MKNKKKGVLIAVVVIALIVAAAVCIKKKQAIQENLKRDRPRQQSKSRIQRS